MRRAVVIMLVALCLTGCRVNESAPWPATASMCWGNGLQPSESVPDVRHFEYQLSSVTPEFLAEQAEAGRTVGLYVPADVIHGWMARSRAGTFAGDWYIRLGAHLAHGLDGNPWQPWPHAAMVNVTDPKAREVMVSTVKEHLPANAEGVTSLMLDYMTVPRPDWSNTGQPDLDLDRDGIGHRADRDEQAALVDAYKALLVEYRKALPGVRLVANGSLALQDTAVTALLDGFYVEGSGAYWPWWNGLRGVEAMLHPDNPGNWAAVSRHLRPGWLSVLEADGGEAYDARAGSVHSVALAMMLTTDAAPVVGVYQGEGHRPITWLSIESWGEAVGRPVEEYRMTQPGLYVRAFENGLAELRIINGGEYPRPFTFRLRTMDGTPVVEF